MNVRCESDPSTANHHDQNHPTPSFSFHYLSLMVQPASAVGLTVKGKRGNIVQTYPAVEYDFYPKHLVVEENSQVHKIEGKSLTGRSVSGRDHLYS